MRRFTVVTFLALLVSLLPSAAAAQTAGDDEGLLLRIQGDVILPEGESVDAVVVIDGNARIEGTVRDTVLVIGGDAIVTGAIEGELTVISGDIRLERGARVKDVTSIRGDITTELGATVTGEIHEREDFDIAGGAVAIFSAVFWLGMTVAVIAAGLIFAAIGGRQLTAAANALTSEAGKTILSSVILWLGLPILAVLAMVTIIGLPLGLGLLLFLLPTLWFLGYIVAGARLGGALVGLTGRQSGMHPYLATFLGLLISQVALWIPVLGALIALLAGMWGAGSLVYVAFRASHDKGSVQPEAGQPGSQGVSAT